jgi:hypothetical protein
LGERSCEKEVVKRVDKDTKRDDDGRTEKNGAGYVVRSGTAGLSGTWDEYSQWPPIQDIGNFKKKSQLFIQFLFILYQ